MKKQMMIATALVLALGQPFQVEADEETSCGALLCLLGGSGVGECNPYLNAFYSITGPTPQDLQQNRRQFLNECPTGMGGLGNMVADYGPMCQPELRVQTLNTEKQLCETQQWGDYNCGLIGMEDQMCAPFYQSEYTAYEAPTMHTICEDHTDQCGIVQQICRYRWTVAGDPAPVLPPLGNVQIPCTQPEPWGGFGE